LIILKAGLERESNDQKLGTVVFEGKKPQIEIKGKGAVNIYYNPIKGTEEHKFYNPNYYGRNVTPSNSETSYMLVNNIYDLQEISWFPSGNYALSQNIDASITKEQNGGKGFMPIGGKRQDGIPFTGNFDGNNYIIKNLYINRPDENDVGIFAFSSGRALSTNVIANLRIEQAHIRGNFRVGALVAEGVKTNFRNVNIVESTVSGYGPVGSISGALENCQIKNVTQSETVVFIDKKPIEHEMIAGAIVCLLCPSFDNDK
jgi:hypothetical protein